MKKVLYIALIAFTCALTATSCTEEEVKPKNTELNGGGSGDDPINKN